MAKEEEKKAHTKTAPVYAVKNTTLQFHVYCNLQMSATLYSILSFSDIRKQKKVFLYLLEFVDSRYVCISYRFYH